jgi:NhaP-type Na+/H+ and K+/H+ antiporter
MSSVFAYLHRVFAFSRNQSIAWLAAVVIFIAIGLFVRSSDSNFTTYILAAILLAVNCLIMGLLKDIGRIRLAILVFLYVLNLILFGYYYFNSITIFY